jgi:hypothetical protein
MHISRLLSDLWFSGYALAWKVPLFLQITYTRWRALINELRRNNAFGLDRRIRFDRRQANAVVAVEHRTRTDRRGRRRYKLGRSQP